MLGHRQISAAAFFDQNQVAAYLPDRSLASFLKGGRGFFPGDVGEPAQFRTGLDGHHDLLLARLSGETCNSLLVFSPQPSTDGFGNVLGFLLALTLRQPGRAGHSAMIQPSSAVWRVT